MKIKYCSIALLISSQIAVAEPVNYLNTILMQNQGRSELAPSINSSKLLTVSGQVNIDEVLSNTSPQPGDRYQPGNSSALTLNSASLFLDSHFSQHVLTHINLHTQTTPNPNSLILQNKAPPVLEEASATFLTNQDNTTFYTRLGRQYVLFGNYELYHMAPSLNQLMTQTNETAMTIGAVFPYNIHAEAYVFNNPVNNHQHAGIDEGMNLGIINSFNTFQYNYYISYMANMAAVDYINSGMVNNNRTMAVPAISSGFSLDYQNFNLTGNYVTSLTSFSPQVIAYEGRGAKPWAADGYLTYKFNSWHHPSTFTAGYQFSGQAVNVGGTPEEPWVPQGMPKLREVLKYGVKLNKYIQIADELLLDHDYGIAQGGTGSSSTTDIIRLAVSFF